MPDLLQRAQGALWRLFLMLAMFGGVGYLVWNAQVDPFPSLVVPSTWFLYSYMLFFPTSRVAVGVYSYFYDLHTSDFTILRSIFIAFFIFQALYQRSPVGIIYPVFLGIINCCVIQCGERRDLAEVAAIYFAACRAATIAATRGLTEAPKPDAAAAEPDQEHDSDNQRALVAFVDGPAVEEVVEPTPRTRGWMKKLWSFLSILLKFGLLALVTHALIDAVHKNWVLNQASVASAPLFEAEVVVQANKTELPIRVPIADFIPTGTFGSPCQAAPTPTPVAKSIATVMSTPMPTPMPAPTPTAVPEPEPKPAPVVLHDEPLKLLHSLFDFDIPGPKPLLAWYFDLPPASQYTVIVISLLLIWGLSKPLITLAAYLVTLASAYFTTAAVLPLLSIYGFTPVQSVVISLTATFILIASILQTRFWLKNLASMSWSNAAGLIGLRSDLDDLRAQSELRLVDIRKFMTAVHTILSDLLSFVDRFKAIAKEHGQAIRKLNSQMKSLVMDKANNVDLEQIMTVINEVSRDLDDLKDSKADAPLLLAVQKRLDTLFPLVDSLRGEKADASDLEKLQRKLDDLSDRFDNLQNANANATEVASINAQMKRLKASLDDILSTQQKLTTRVDTLQAEMNDAQTEIDFFREEGTAHESSISRLDGESKTSRKAIHDLKDQVADNKQDADDKVSKLERENAELRKESAQVSKNSAEIKEENTALRRAVGSLQDDMTAMQKEMRAVQTKQTTHKTLQDELWKNITSDVDLKVSQLRSETGSKHERAVQDHKALQDSVDTRFADSTRAVEKFEEEAKGRFNWMGNWANDKFKAIGGTCDKLVTHKDEANNRFDEISTMIAAADERVSDVLRRVEAVETQQHDSIASLGANHDIRSMVHKYVEEFLVSEKFRAAVKETQLMFKKQSNRERLRGEVHATVEELLDSEYIQQTIYDNIQERQALNNLPGDPPGVISGGQASSPGTGPSNSLAAPTNMDGNDDLPGDPAEVVSGGRATLPGGMSSDSTNTPTIPEESTIPDDVDDHGTLGVLSDDPPILRRRSMSLGGSTSDGPSGDGGVGPRPSGGDDDDTLQQKQREGEDSYEHDALNGEELPGPANRDQPGGEQDEKTDEEDTDDDNDDEARDGRDDNDSDGDDPPGPPPGSGGGSHGHNGTGGKGDDDRGGSKRGAPPPPPASGTSRGGLGLTGSRFAPGNFQSRTPAAGTAHHNNSSGGSADDHQSGRNRGTASPAPASGVSQGRNLYEEGEGAGRDDDDCAEDHSEKTYSSSPAQELRSSLNFRKDLLGKIKESIAEVEKEQAQQKHGKPQSRQSTPAEVTLHSQWDTLGFRQQKLQSSLNRAEEAYKRAEEAKKQAEQAQNQPEPTQKQQQEAQDRRPKARKELKEGADLLEQARILLGKEPKPAKQQKQGQQNEPSQAPQNQGGDSGGTHRGNRGKKGRDKQQSNQGGNQPDNGQANGKGSQTGGLQKSRWA